MDTHNRPYMEPSFQTHFNNTWLVIEKYFGHNKGHLLIKHLLDSYNDFVLRKIDDIIDGFNPIEVHHMFLPEEEKFRYILTIEVKNPVISKPMIYEKDGSTKLMTPNDARTRNFTYSAPLYVDVNIAVKTFNEETKEYTLENKKINNINLGKLPIMVKSKYCILYDKPFVFGECKYDSGGYFIVNGNEKVIISQDRIAENKTYVFLSNKPGPYSHVAEIRSVQENKFSVPKTTSLKLSAKPNQFGRYIRANIHHIKHDIPVLILFRALGVETDKDIIKYIVYDLGNTDNEFLMKELVGSVEEANNVSCSREAFEYLSKYININGYPKEILNNKVHRMQILRNILRNEFLPHVGVDFHKKALYLGFMINKLLKCFLGFIPYDDRDSYINKRIDTPGILLANLFRQAYGKVVKDMKNMIQKDINAGSWRATNRFINVITKTNINKIIKSTTIESALKYGLATGNWGIKNNKTKQGVAQVLNRLTYSATISHLRRINTPIEKTGKLVLPRKLHSTQWGIICPSETPEGVSVGLVKNMSLISNITIASNSSALRELLESTDMIMFDGTNIDIFSKGTKVIVNGDIIGVHLQPNILFNTLKMWKVSGIINVSTGIYWCIYQNELWVCTEGGRCIRPCYIVENNRIRLEKHVIDALKSNKIEWINLVVGYDNHPSIIEYLDVEETNLAMIAMRYQDLFRGKRGSSHAIDYTHLELDPSLMLGILAGSIPFSNHNQSPRNCYQCLGLNENVLMADYSVKHIKDVNIGDEVICFNPDTLMLSSSKVINHYIRPTSKQMFKITTVSGRSISATYDHKFMTTSYSFVFQWLELAQLDQEHTLLGICPYATFDLSSFGLKTSSEFNVCTAKLIGYCCNSTRDVLFFDSVDMTVFTNDMKISGFQDFVVQTDRATVKLDPLFFKLIEGFDLYTLVQKDVYIQRAFLGSVFARMSTGLTWNRDTDKFNCTISSIHESILKVISQLLDTFRIIHVLTETKILIDDSASLLCIYENIGFNYNSHLYIMSSIHGEYLKMKSYKKSSTTCFSSWAANVVIKGSMIFIPIDTIEKIDNHMISDITVASSSHSFIGGDCFAVHNSAMGKQAIGVYASNYLNRYDTLGHVLNYPQVPLVQTRPSKIVNNDKLPCGLNVIVAIACWTGFNQEDSIIMNQSAVDRGMFISTYYRTYKEQNIKNHSTGEEEYFCKPDPSTTKQIKPFNYDKLTNEGFVEENTMVEAGDIIIGKCMPQKNGNIMMNKDASVVLKNNEKGFIDRNCINDKYFTNTNGDGYTFAKIRIRSDRIPCIGDKFSSRHGQKGTIGMLYRHEDMPFCSDGTVPDIIINPHAIPSRMTIAQLMETIMGTACVGLGTMGDATPFTSVTVEDIANACSKCGLERFGNSVMYNSRTGEQMDMLVFKGFTYYQRLKHMVDDKLHSRAANGPVVMLTRQPAEGRARDGGLRLGEMEIECNWAHGTMQFLKERFMECSDNYRVFVCKKCGIMANVNPEKGIYSCKPCKNITHFSEIRIPYACKLLFQEIQTMGIAAKFMT